MINKVIVFDLDETLGYFTQLGVLFDTLELYTNNDVSFNIFSKIFDIYEETFRVNIFTILNYLKRIKSNDNIKIIIYTNNQADKTWAINIVKYIEERLSYNLFDHIIHAYKIGNTRVEQCRTSHDKKYSDLIKCANLPENAKICFIDDQFHRHMKHKNVYYINIKPYTYRVNNDDLCDRFFDSKVFIEIMKLNKINDEEHFTSFIKNQFTNIKLADERKPDQLKSDKILTKRIMYHIQKFITRRNVTKKNRSNNSNKKTRKNKS